MGESDHVTGVVRAIDVRAADPRTLALAWEEARESQQRLERWADAIDSKTVSLFTVSSAALAGVAVLHQGPFTGWAAVLWWAGFAFWGAGTISAFYGFYAKQFSVSPDPRKIMRADWLQQTPERYQASRLEDLANDYARNRPVIDGKVGAFKVAVICTALEIAALVVAALLG